MSAAFYLGQGDCYTATPSTVGPWDSRLQHGGPVAALLGSRIEAAAASSHQRVAQVAMDFFGPVPVATLDVKTELLRPGKKISLWSAEAAVAGRRAVRVNAWLLAVEEGRNPAVRLDDTPAPLFPERAVETYFSAVPRFGYGDALEWRFAEGGFDSLGPATVWSKLRVAIVDGEPVSPLSRVLAMVDSANGISAELDVGAYLFVPVHLTVTVARPPRGEWVCMRAVTSLSSDGVGVTRAQLFDERAMIGEALQTLYVDKR
jgi:Thioesterase-like superfamily